VAKNQGIKSKNKREVGYRQGQQRQRKVPAGVAQLGQRQGNHITDSGSTRYGGVSINAGVGIKSELGNAKALELAGKGKAGPGAGREVMPSGSQCMTGPVNRGEPMPKAKALWPGWESKR
jgi:hypothetical protein